MADWFPGLCRHCRGDLNSKQEAIQHLLVRCPAFDDPSLLEANTRFRDQRRQRKKVQKELAEFRRQAPRFEGMKIARLSDFNHEVLTLHLKEDPQTGWDLEFRVGARTFGAVGDRLSFRALETLRKVCQGRDLNLGTDPIRRRIQVSKRDGVGTIHLDLSTLLGMQIPGENIYWSVTLTLDPRKDTIHVSNRRDSRA